MLSNNNWLCARPIAHRGLHDKANAIIENTASAFAAAIEHGYAIECDVQISADGEAMVFHDYTLDRLTLDHGLVAQKSTRKLMKTAYKTGLDHIITLPDLLSQTAGKVPLIIELKSTWNNDLRLVHRTIELVRDYQGPVALMSFDPELVIEIRLMAPDIMRGLIADQDCVHDDFHLSFAKRLAMRHLDHLSDSQPDFLSYAASDLPASASRKFIRANKPVICWTIRSPQQARTAYNYCQQITFEGFRPNL